MFLLYGLTFALLLCGLPVLLIWQYRREGILGLVKLTLVAWGVLSGALWLTKHFQSSQLDGSVGIGESIDWLYSLPWGTIWIIDTLLLGAFAAFLIMSSRHPSVRTASGDNIGEDR
ncbi:MAG: hypothetical protein V4713_03625 [Pseudomonadota bacterium]